MSVTPITSPNAPEMETLCGELAALADGLQSARDWPAEQLRLCGEYGVHRWFVATKHGGYGWSDADQVRGYLRLSAACLTTTFILTQRNGALRRIAEGDNPTLAQRLLPDLLSGKTFATVAISHLTTSRRHLGKPSLLATPDGEDFLLNGYSAWVTGSSQADVIVTGAALEDGRQILIAVQTDLSGVVTPPPEDLLALSASQTGRVELNNVRVGRVSLLAGPMHHVMASAVGAKAGGLQTSTLAVGLSQRAISFLQAEAVKRPELLPPLQGFQTDCEELRRDLLAAAAGEGSCSQDDLRQRANRLVLRVTQAALTAAKGAGFVASHPAGRWAREAMFFLVWSCPAPVANAVLCELAGLNDL